MTQEELKYAYNLDAEIEDIRHALLIAVNSCPVLDLVVRSGDMKKVLTFRIDKSDFARSIIDQLREHKQLLEDEFEKL